MVSCKVAGNFTEIHRQNTGAVSESFQRTPLLQFPTFSRKTSPFFRCSSILKARNGAKVYGFVLYAETLKHVTEKWELCMENYGKL